MSPEPTHLGASRRVGITQLLAAFAVLACSSGEEIRPVTESAAGGAPAGGAAGGPAGGAGGVGEGGGGGAGGEEVGRCFHDVCATGDYLEAACDPCVDAVCARDDYCCAVQWDSFCVVLATELSDLCTCAPEVACTGLQDEDFDGLVDCEDPDCAAGCTPGTAPFGDPCDEATDCAAATPACLDEDTFGWAGGYCTGLCAPGSDACGPGVPCVATAFGPTEVGLCHPLCDPGDPSACRAGYACVDDGAGGDPHCRPIPEDCFNGADDDLDGEADCADPECQVFFECWEDCVNGADDDGDGVADCDDPSCAGFPTCIAWVCEDLARSPASSCIAIGGGVACHPITNEGCAQGLACDAHYGAYAFECREGPQDAAVCAPCDDEQGCAPGSTCVAVEGVPGGGHCARFCCADFDCGGGICNKGVVTDLIGLISPIGVCVE